MENLKKYLDEVEKEPYYKSIKNLGKIFEDSGMIVRSGGHCIAISDLVQRLLKEQGIDSYLEECTLSVITRDPFSKIDLLGHETTTKRPQHEIETHVICITKTKIPILIDLSIEYITKKVDYIIFPIFPELVSNEENIATIDFGHSVWIYNKRTIGSLPKLHEKSILDRINTDIKIENQISLINKIIIIICAVTSLNFIRGSYDFYQNYLNKPKHLSTIPSKVDKIEKNLYK